MNSVETYVDAPRKTIGRAVIIDAGRHDSLFLQVASGHTSPSYLGQYQHLFRKVDIDPVWRLVKDLENKGFSTYLGGSAVAAPLFKGDLKRNYKDLDLLAVHTLPDVAGLAANLRAQILTGKPYVPAPEQTAPRFAVSLPERSPLNPGHTYLITGLNDEAAITDIVSRSLVRFILTNKSAPSTAPIDLMLLDKGRFDQGFGFGK